MKNVAKPYTVWQRSALGHLVSGHAAVEAVNLVIRWLEDTEEAKRLEEARVRTRINNNEYSNNCVLFSMNNNE